MSAADTPEEMDISDTGLDAEVEEEKSTAFDESTEFKFKTHNGRAFSLTYKQAKISKNLLKVAMERQVENETVGDTIDLPELTQGDTDDTIVNKIIEYMVRRDGTDFKDGNFDKFTMPVKYGYEFDEKKNMGTWTQNWGDAKQYAELDPDHPDKWAMRWIVIEAKNRKNFYKLLSAANHFDIMGLLGLGLMYIASLLKFCPVDDIDRVLDPAITDGSLKPMRPEAELMLDRERKSVKIVEKKAPPSS